MSDPVIKPLPTKADISSWVNELIEPRRSDGEAKRLIDIIFAIANPDNEAHWELAMTAAREAYLLTRDFEESFDMFARGQAAAVKPTNLSFSNKLISNEEQ